MDIIFDETKPFAKPQTLHFETESSLQVLGHPKSESHVGLLLWTCSKEEKEFIL